jgi:type II secretory pathway predicted ATPase ExeA
LRGRTQRRQIVALLFDNARDYADSTVKRVIESFLTADLSLRDGNLLQVVLAGRPQIKAQLARIARLPTQLEAALICELHALTAGDVIDYVQHGLRASGLPDNSFEARAVERIARLSNGVPRTSNAIAVGGWKLPLPAKARR